MKVLLVDDEIFAIRMLQNIIPWDELGLEVAEYAQSGEEAYQKVLKEKPDIIISDIRMCGMSGIDLLKKVHNYDPGIRVILMSAYADFSYVRDAIKAGGSDYILKPVDEVELEHSLRKVIAEIQGEKEQEKKLSKSEDQLLRMTLYRYMKTGKGKNKVLNSGQKFLLQDYRVFLIRLDSSTSAEFDNSASIELGNERYILNIIEQTAQKWAEHSYIFDYDEECWSSVWEGLHTERPEECAQEIISRLKEEAGISVNVSFSSPGNSLEKLPELYEETADLDKYSFYVGDVNILGYGYNCSKKEMEEIRDIGNSRENCRQEQINSPDSGEEKECSRPVKEGIALIREKYDKTLSLEEICAQVSVSKNYFCYLFKRETGMSIWNYLTEVRLKHAKELLKNTNMKSYEIAFAVGYENPSYFSKIFKKYENMTPNEYREQIK